MTQRCGSTELTLLSRNDYPDGRKKLYVYKCVCGLAFTSNDHPQKNAAQTNQDADVPIVRR